MCHTQHASTNNEIFKLKVHRDGSRAGSFGRLPNTIIDSSTDPSLEARETTRPRHIVTAAANATYNPPCQEISQHRNHT